jgi:adenosylcobyric acid synthase
MIQGTMSNAGKSVLTAGLCRVFVQDGHRVAPFKSQNMALNSFITHEGLEMGRAQVMQAEAAGILPEVRMNPVLLKPTSDMGSQVIVNGEVFKNMSAVEYFAYKHNLIPDILRAFESLGADYDIIVIEGAGSPAEINLKQHDIVNMGMAKMAKSPVLLAGDIDRGGVFASLYGTVSLLENEERSLIKGFLINKFRGDPEILKPGLTMLEEKTGIPVLGVIPYLNIDLDDEDSLSPRLEREGTMRALDIAVVRLPRLSNFTDFNALGTFDCLSVRYIQDAAQLKTPDLIILPGTKNTMGDLLWMRQNGLETAIYRLAGEGTPVIGICGGYQMLGTMLHDPDNLEHGGNMRGMGLLPMETVFEPKKVRTRVNGEVLPLNGFFSPLSGSLFSGYEIHMGRTMHALPAFSSIEDNIGKTADGAAAGCVLGSYVHGLFDEGNLADRLVNLLLAQKGLTAQTARSESFLQYKERQYDILADALRKNTDILAIYDILEKGV